MLGFMKRHTVNMRRSSIGGLLVVVVLAAVSSIASAGQQQRQTIRFDRAQILFELNATAQDAGIQALLDAEGWETVTVLAPDGQELLEVEADGSVGDIGVTELFFESAEPSLADLPLDELLAMFPEGRYRFVGRTVEGQRLVGAATLSHDIPAGPVVLSPVEGGVTDPNHTVISWQPVTEPPGIGISGYQVIVELPEPLRIFSVDLPASDTSVTVPAEFLEPGTDYKFEVIAVADNHNQTITEGTFSTT
jgi:Fibronectin type III domain